MTIKAFNWQLATGNWQLATGNWQLATGNWQRSCFWYSSAEGTSLLKLPDDTKLAILVSVIWKKLKSKVKIVINLTL